MKFHVNNIPRKLLNLQELPAFVLELNNWDDYHTKSTFILKHYDSDRCVNIIGEVKIIKKGVSSTITIENNGMSSVLPLSFDLLDNDFISLGQNLDFYENLLGACGRDTAIEALIALREVSWQPQFAAPFEPTAPFRNSLLRENSAHKARRFGRAVINGEKVDESFSFNYTTLIPGAEEPTETLIGFNEHDSIPGRIVGIIGRNAVGKTRYLANLAEDLVQIRQTSAKRANARDERFGGQRPIFNRVITISYSAFDKFARPKAQQASYIYCGIRKEKGGLSRTSLLSTYKENLQRIRELDRQHSWIELMQEILGDQSQTLKAHLDTEISSQDSGDEALSLLSSGQAILANFITSLIAWLEPSSLVLFDEPETHLHPNAVASLFNVLNKALSRYDSFAIVATHSPVVIQEIPSKRVVLFERNGNVTTASRLPVETFGQNISELTRHVFETIEVPSYYKKVLAGLARYQSFEEVMALFDDNLSINAQSYLATRYLEDNQ